VLSYADPRLVKSLLAELASGSAECVPDYERIALTFAQAHKLHTESVLATVGRISALVTAERADFSAYKATA
jgi:hypothetical protein